MEDAAARTYLLLPPGTLVVSIDAHIRSTLRYRLGSGVTHAVKDNSIGSPKLAPGTEHLCGKGVPLARIGRLRGPNFHKDSFLA